MEHYIQISERKAFSDWNQTVHQIGVLIKGYLGKETSVLPLTRFLRNLRMKATRMRK